MAKGKYEYWLTPEGLIKLEGWARDGLTDKQIAHNIGITEQTLNNWKNTYPSFFESLKKGKEIIDYEVENALLKRALGCTVKEERLTKDGEVVELEREIPGDVTAQIFWLKNRKPTEWKDKREEIDPEEEKETVRIELTRNGKKYGETDNP